MIHTSRIRQSIVLFTGACLTCQSACGAATTTAFLVNPGIYTAVGSSEFADFGNFSVGQMFDDNRDSEWAIDGYAGRNPQGRDEGWASIVLDQTYLITQIRLAPRRPSGSTDGIDRAYLWISTSPFNVNVRSAAATSAFAATPTGQTPTMTVGPFATLNEVDYPLASPIAGRYLLARFINTSDHDSNRNLSVGTLEVGVAGVVPEPSALVLSALGLTGVFDWLRRRRPSS